MPISVPEDFRYLVRLFHQDIHLFVSTEKELARYLVEGLNPHQKMVVKEFVSSLLDREPDGEELQELWESCSPDWSFGDAEELRKFLAMTRDGIETN